MKLLDSKGILLYASYAKHDTFFTLKAQPPENVQKSVFWKAFYPEVYQIYSSSENERLDV